MYRKTFRLTQHTPQIHFQYDQPGATLRSTEVKPALDRYLLKKHTGTPPNEWLNGAFRKKKGKERTALDYKLHFRALDPVANKARLSNKGGKRIPMFFGDLEKKDDQGNTEERSIGYIKYDEIEGVLSCTSRTLLEHLQRHLADFFRSHTFGMRSSKGYGSYSLQPTVGFAKATAQPRFSFIATGKNWQQQFEKIDLFYKSVRGGINGVYALKADNFYMKPLLWVYARANDKVWEKRYIKENAPRGFFPLSEQRETGRKRRDGKPEKKWFPRDADLNAQETQAKFSNYTPADRDYPLWFADNGHDDREAVIVRDIFGLSTNQSWRGYGGGHNASVNKTDAAGSNGIQRAASPWVFKPEVEGNNLRVNVFVNPIPPLFKKASFRIEADGSTVGTLPIWKDFDMNEFINDYLTVAHFTNAVQQNATGYGAPEGKAFNILNAIYTDIQRTKRNG